MTTPALSAKDYENAGFHWLDCHQEERCIYAFERTDGKERIAAVFNFSDEEQKGYKLPENIIHLLCMLMQVSNILKRLIQVPLD